MEVRKCQCFEPVYNQDSRLLILGTAPSIKSCEAGFYYGHPQNRFWKLMARLCQCQVPETIQQKKEMLLKNGIALWDVIASCDIVGSADDSITNVVENDFTTILAESKITKIYTNGGKAQELYRKRVEKKTVIKSIGLPSTSPLNARYNLERLYEEWYGKIGLELIK